MSVSTGKEVGQVFIRQRMSIKAAAIAAIVMMGAGFIPLRAQSEPARRATDAESFTRQDPVWPAESLSDRNRAVIQSLIEDLTSPEYQVREEATDRLLELGNAPLPQLRDAYVHSDDLEQLLRIEQIVHNAYLDHRVYQRNGYLGVAYAQNFFPDANTFPDNPLPEGATGILVTQVQPSTAAQRAGLRDNDIIIELDDLPLDELAQGPVDRNFASAITDRGPGSPIRLTVVRAGRVIRLEAVLQSRPRELYDPMTYPNLAQRLREASEDLNSWFDERFRSPRDRIQSGDQRLPATQPAEGSNDRR